MTERPTAIIISGAPGTGKTTLGERLARDLRLSFLSKDRIKETLFETLGWSDRDWSRKLGGATISLLYLWAETEMQAGRSFVVECNFRPDIDTRRFLALKTSYGFDTIEVYCHTEPSALLARLRARMRTGERHPGHVDLITLPEIEAELLKGTYHPMDLGGKIYQLDTTEFSKLDYPALLDATQHELHET